MTITTPEPTKPCVACGDHLPYSSFGKDPRMKLGIGSYCNPCRARLRRERYARNPEKYRAIQRERARRERTPEQTRRRHLWAMYRLSMDDYNAMLEAQDNRCAICRTDAPGGKGDWHVDHCHETKAVRALLCSGCNVGIALLAHDAERMRAAADYIELHSQEGVA